MTEPLARLQSTLADRYEIDREIGMGGMATVYLAQDLRHDRRVALKLLRPELGAVIGAERFLAEIRTTAKLQHPHILPLFDSGEAAGLLFYVMPYVEGVSLRQRLEREKQLPIAEAVRIATEIASALDYAHRHGVIHRDIKPENVLLHDGQALVADFGIALAVSNAGATRMTETGMSLGTPHYMSPEQAMGEREITSRSDVYALGAVTYEMLVGEPPFTGPTAQAIVAKVVTEEPRSLVPKRHTIPPHVDEAVRTALEKLPADRFESAAEFARALKDPGYTTRTTAHGTPRPLPAQLRTRNVKFAGVAALAALLLASAAFAVGRVMSDAQVHAPVVGRFVIATGADHRLSGVPAGIVALSPDGTTLVYVGQNARGTQLYRRKLDELVASPIAGSEGAIFPFFTPDGQWVAFSSGSSVKKIPLSGGAAITVAGSASLTSTWFWQGGTFLDPQTLVLSDLRGGVRRLGSDGRLTIVATPDSAAGETALLVVDALDRETVLVIAAPGATVTGKVYALNTNSGRRTLVLDQNVSGVGYDPSGYLVWVQPDGAIVGAVFDAKRLRLASSPVMLAQGVRVVVGGPPQVALSRNGSLVYVPESPFELRRVGRDGRSTPLLNVERRFHSPRVSPDGRWVAIDFPQQGSRDVWTLDLQQNTLARLTFDDDGHDPVWTRDGRRVAYASARGGIIGMFLRNADGSGGTDSLYVGGSANTVGSFVPSGDTAVVITTGTDGSFDLTTMPLRGSGRPTPLLVTPYNEGYPALSPDGKWLAYVSDESGQFEVYVRPFPGPGAKVLVSQNGGSEPVWSRSGHELYYRGFGQQGAPLVGVGVRLDPRFAVVSRAELFDVTEFEAAAPHANYDIAPDGSFVMVYQGRLSEIVLLNNWTEEVRRRGAAAGR